MATTGLGIDFGAHSVRAARGRLKGKDLEISRLLRSSVSRDERTGAAEAGPRESVAALSDAGNKKGRAAIGLTGRDVILRYTQVPPMPDHRLRALMAFEIREIAEKAGGGVASDYRAMTFQAVDGGESTVLVGLAKETFLKDRFGPLEEAGFVPAFACPDSIALYNSFLRFGNFQAGETTLLLDIGAENTDLAIQRDGDLLFARNLSVGGRAFTEAVMAALGADYKKAEELKLARANVAPPQQARFSDPAAEKASRALAGPCGQIFSLAQSTVAFCRTQTKIPDLRVDRVYLSGGGASLRGLPESFTASFGVPAERFDPLRALDLSLLPREEAQQAKEAPWEFAVPLGLLVMTLDPRFFRLELAPEAVRKRRAFKQRTSFLIASGAAAAVYLIAAGVVGSHNLAVADQGVKQMQQRDSAVSRDAERYDALKREAEYLATKDDRLADRVNAGMDFARALEACQRILREYEELWIKSATFKPATSVAQKGGAASAPAVWQPPEMVLQGAGREGGRDLGQIVNQFGERLRGIPGVAESRISGPTRQKTFEVRIVFERAASESSAEAAESPSTPSGAKAPAAGKARKP